MHLCLNACNAGRELPMHEAIKPIAGNCRAASEFGRRYAAIELEGRWLMVAFGVDALFDQNVRSTA